jgi:chromosome partitioning protein
MKTIALIAQKGGSGKTTLALSLAVAAEAAGRTTMIVDLDPQASACKWGDRRQAEAPLIIDAQPSRLTNALGKAAQGGVDLAIIDTPARIEQAAAEAARVADLVIIPTRPSIYDLETLQTSIDLIKGRAKRPPVVVLNAVPPQSGRREQASQAIGGMGADICPAFLGHRVAYEYAAQLGQSAAEYEPDGKAAAEIQAVYASVCQLLDLSTLRRTDKKTKKSADEATPRRAGNSAPRAIDTATQHRVGKSTQRRVGKEEAHGQTA